MSSIPFVILCILLSAPFLEQLLLVVSLTCNVEGRCALTIMKSFAYTANTSQDPPEDAVVTVCGHVFCNQCICEHMIGEETRCPNKNCKTRLTLSHIFSNTTLRAAISDHPNPQNHHTNCSDSELAKVSESCSLSYPEGSSKIKAALELLTALSKPHDPASTLSSLEPIEGCYGSDLLHGCDSVGKYGTSEIKNDSHNPVKVMGEKAIVFSQWTRMLDLLEDYLKNSSIQYRRLDGTMPISVRDRAVKDFNTLSEVCHSSGMLLISLGFALATFE